jgi:hypothetical protein
MPDARRARVVVLPGYGVCKDELDEDQRTPTLWVRQVGKPPSCTCRGCGISTAAARGTPGERSLRDLPRKSVPKSVPDPNAGESP